MGRGVPNNKLRVGDIVRLRGRGFANARAWLPDQVSVLAQHRDREFGARCAADFRRQA